MAKVGRWLVRGTSRFDLVLIGAATVLVLIAFTLLDWYDSHVIGRALDFATLRADLDALGRPALTRAYFDWLSWFSLALTLLLAVLARTHTSRVLRAVAALIGLGSIVLGYVALEKLFAYAQRSGERDVGVFAHVAPGLYLAVAGFLLFTAAALVTDRS